MSLRDELQAIYDQHGELTPRLVVEVAKDESHPLHSRFEWDDAIAGEAWRQEQAHRLIQKVKCVYREATDTEPERLGRKYLPVHTERGYVYEPVEKVAADPLLAQMQLRDMERDWRELRRRYEHFSEFWAMVRKDSAA